jgi:hypothetical protein
MTGSPSIVPETPDRDVYFVLDDFGGRLGRAWREMEEEATERATLIRDLLDGQYASPVRIVAFITAEGWSRDASEEIATELLNRCAERDEPPPSLQHFLQRYQSTRQPTQLALRF